VGLNALHAEEGRHGWQYLAFRSSHFQAGTKACTVLSAKKKSRLYDQDCSALALHMISKTKIL